MTTDQLAFQAGDILFFRLRSFDNDDQYQDFAHLAAYVQSFPYAIPAGPSGPFVAPWHHVGVATSTTHIAQFQQGGEVGNWKKSISNEAIQDQILRTQTFDIVRPRDRQVAAALAEASAALVGVPYEQGALLGFAAASKARMILGQSRTKTMEFARGIESTVFTHGTKGHTCVSAVITALLQAGVQLRISEPGSFLSSTNAPGLPTVLAQDLDAPLTELLNKVNDTFTLLGLTRGGAVTDDDTVFAAKELVTLWNFPGGDLTTEEYLNGISRIVRELFAHTNGSRILRAGQTVDPLFSTGWLASPAMLHRALEGFNFQFKPVPDASG